MRDPSFTSESSKSRGLLTIDYLRSTLSPNDYLHQVVLDYKGERQPFNLIVGTISCDISNKVPDFYILEGRKMEIKKIVSFDEKSLLINKQ